MTYTTALRRISTLTMATILGAATLAIATPPAHAATIAVGNESACAVTSKGAAKCWGYGELGELGNGSGAGSNEPKQVKGLTKNVSSIAMGSNYACAIQGPKGTLFCWGRNEYGQLGDGTKGNKRLAPVKVKKMGKGVVDVAAGSSHTCAIQGKKRTLFCWGNNFHGQLGTGPGEATKTTPVKVKKMGKGVHAIAVGRDHTCAIQGKKRNLFCWGYNGFGQVGDGTAENDRRTPVKVKVGKGVIAVAAGEYHACAIQGAKRALSCWGSNVNGQLGNGTDGDPVPLPAKVGTMGSGVAAIGLGDHHSCAIKGAERTLFCWGQNTDGQIGDGTTDSPTDSPVKVVKMSKGVAEVAGGGNTCAFKGKVLFCWGYNGSGQVGDGTFDERHSPVKVKL